MKKIIFLSLLLSFSLCLEEKPELPAAFLTEAEAFSINLGDSAVLPGVWHISDGLDILSFRQMAPIFSVSYVKIWEIYILNKIYLNRLQVKRLLMEFISFLMELLILTRILAIFSRKRTLLRPTVTIKQLIVFRWKLMQNSKLLAGRTPQKTRKFERKSIIIKWRFQIQEWRYSIY